MKSLLLLVVLAALSVSNEAAAIQEFPSLLPALIATKQEGVITDSIKETAVTVRANINIGSLGSRDRLLRRDYFRMTAVAGVVQYADVRYSGSSSIRIAAIRVIEQGASQNASPSIRAGGLGRNHVTIRMTTARGRGFHYMVEIWGN